MGIKSTSGPGAVDAQDARVTQFGEQIFAQPTVDLYLQGEYLPDELRTTVAQTDGSDLVGASVTNQGDVYQIDSGTGSGESVKVESNRTLNYAFGKEADWSAMTFRDDVDKVVDDQVYRFGAFTNESGLFFEETADELRAVVRQNSTDRVLTDISTSEPYIKDGIFDLFKAKLTRPRIWFIRFAHYGAGKVIFGTRESLRINPRNPGQVEQRALVYQPTEDPTLESPGRLYMETANLPTRFEIDNGGTTPSSAAVYQVGDSQLSLLGGDPKRSRQISEVVRDVTVTGGTTEPVVAIRPKATFKGLDNNANVEVDQLEIRVDSDGDNVEAWIEIGADVTAGTFQDGQYAFATAAEVATGSAVGELADGSVPTGDLAATSGTGGRADTIFGQAGGEGAGEFGSTSTASVDQPLGVEQAAVVFARAPDTATTFDIAVRRKESH